MEDWMTYAEVSTEYKIKLGTLYSLVAQGRIPHVRLGRRFVRFSRPALQAWLRHRTVEPAA
jgi:excisionase family DNA binding protein